MQHPLITTLWIELHKLYGKESVVPYGGALDEEDSAGFRINTVPATFSAVADRDGTNSGVFNIQVESFPPGDYVFTDNVTLSEFMHIIERVKANDWP